MCIKSKAILNRDLSRHLGKMFIGLCQSKDFFVYVKSHGKIFVS